MALRAVLLDEELDKLTDLATLKCLSCHDCPNAQAQDQQEDIGRRIVAILENHTIKVEAA